MRTRISPDNPHGYNRYGFAWQHVPRGSAAHLDFGCYHGAFLNTLKGKGIARLVGVDISQDAISNARERFPDLEIVHISKTVPLPFTDRSFTSITVLDVIEHVYEQHALLNELNRVLQDNGVLIVTVPGRHIFSFFDLGNLKFLFPKLHRWHYCRKHSVDQYEYRYVSSPDGLIGDVSSRKCWHEHFSRKTLTKLLKERGFKIADFDGSGFFSRVINCVDILFRGLRPLRSVISKIKNLDAKWFKSTNLFCIAWKQAKP